VGNAAGRHAPQARVPRHRSELKKLLKVPPLLASEGRECSLLACLAVASGGSYDELMGASGAAFTTTIDAQMWDPLAASPLDAATRDRAARAAGLKLDVVTPPFDDEMRALVLDSLSEAIAGKLPPLVRGAVGPPEYGLLVGYDDRGPTLFVRSYFDTGDEPSSVGWDAFAGPEKGEIAFVARGPSPDRSRIAREAIARAAADGPASDEALRAWLAGLRDESRWSDPKHGGTAAFADHAMRTILADKRRAAGRYLRSVRELFPARLGGEILRAAEAYGKVADAAERVGVGPFDPGIATRFVEGGLRRAWANALERVLGHEAEAHEALAAAAK
jgi:hypothetical protein